MTNDEINALKREHDALYASGRELVAQLEDIADKVLALRDRIEEAEGHDYESIKILFCGTFDIDED